jgi:hypothetical protein
MTVVVLSSQKFCSHPQQNENAAKLTKRGASETLISTQAAMALVGYFVLR